MATQTNRSMVSETSICNQALSWLGQGRIESLQEPTRSAEFCADNYPFIRDSVLEDGYWSFAVARDVSTVADQPVWDAELYLHGIPLDWVSVEQVLDTSKCEIEWEVEGRNVLAPLTTIWMRGTERITDTGKFSPLFVQALAARLAVDLAIPIAGSKSLQADMWSLYERKIATAQGSDRQQKSRLRRRRQQTRGSRFITTRRGQEVLT